MGACLAENAHHGRCVGEAARLRRGVVRYGEGDSALVLVLAVLSRRGTTPASPRAVGKKKKEKISPSSEALVFGILRRSTAETISCCRLSSRADGRHQTRSRYLVPINYSVRIQTTGNVPAISIKHNLGRRARNIIPEECPIRSVRLPLDRHREFLQSVRHLVKMRVSQHAR